MRGKREKKKVELWVSVSGEISTKWRRSGPYEKPARGWLLVQTICRPFVSTRCWIVRKRQYSFIYSIRFTIWNSNFRISFSRVTCVEFCEDSSLLAVGFSDSILKVWSLVPQKLRAMKPAEQLADIDKEAEDVLVRMMDDKTGETMKVLYGHCGPVYAASFSHDRTLLLSSSEDATIRLWSLQTWTCLVVYKGHIYPVWDVRFSPHGYYFSSVGHDRTARLWATDHHQPLRIFAGHYSDVDVVQFHPNSNYVATGSSDRSVRLWDCVNGNCVRLMTGHKV